MSKHHLVEIRTCQPSTCSWRLDLGVSVIALALAFAVACSKTPKDKPQPVQAQSTAESNTTPQAKPADEKRAKLDKLAQAYHSVRCVLIGAKAGSDKMYDDLGYGDAEGFNNAFEEAARRNPAWGKATLAASYARSCLPSAP